jgi:hypothetical protein
LFLGAKALHPALGYRPFRSESDRFQGWSSQLTTHTFEGASAVRSPVWSGKSDRVALLQSRSPVPVIGRSSGGGKAIALRVKLFRSQVVKFTSWAALQNAI